MQKILFILLLNFCISTCFSQNNWILATNTKGIKIYTTKTDTTGIKQLKAFMIVKAPIDSVSKKIIDITQLKTWAYQVSDARLVKKISDTSWVFYIKNHVEWPIKDRDHVAKLAITKQSNQHWITITPVNNIVKEKTGLVRIKNFKGSWYLKKINNQYTQVTHQLYANPESNLPYFIINSLLIKAPLESFKNLKDQLEKP